MLPQPPPNAPAPPPSEAEVRSRRKWRALWIPGTVSMLAVAITAAIAIRRQRIHAYTMEATSNLRSMSLALFEFEAAYGSYPSDLTITPLQSNTGTALTLGTKSSNDYFRQLLAAEISWSEALFYARIPGAHKPDNRFASIDALAKGEVGYSYIVGLDSKSHPGRPLVVTPLIPGTNRFDPKPFNGVAIILTVDGSMTRTGPVYPINAKGEVIDSSGKHILDPANPIWGGKAPVIAWPE